MKKLENKIILVTGGSGLLGKPIIAKITGEGGTAVNADIAVESDHAAHTVRCDITDESSVISAIEEIMHRYGRIDGLVNNAYPRTKDWGAHFEDIPVASWKQNLDLQLNSVFILSRHVLKIMKKQGHGSVVNISSIYGTVGPDFSVYDETEMTMPAAYSAIKGGLVNFSRYLASYYAASGIRVNCVSPGGIFDGQPEQFVKNYEKKVPMKRMGLPADIAPAVCFLLGDDASYITGQNLHVDGGWTAI